MAVVTIASSKGGAGKTTLARLLVGHAAQHGQTVAALDADLNHSLASWLAGYAKLSQPVECRAVVDEAQIVPVIEELNDAHDLVVVDTAGAAGQATLFAVGCADLVLVPLKLSQADVAEAVKTMKLVQNASSMLKREITARLVLTGFKPRTQVAAHVQDFIKAAKLPVLETRLHDLVAFEDMTFTGIAPLAGIAGMQAANLFEEVTALTGGPQASRKVA